jgi:hypothetical protein
MKYRYFFCIDGKEFKFEKQGVNPSDDDTPVFENISYWEKVWSENCCWHRLTGPAYIRSDGREEFWLNDKKYHNIKEWINEHPNPDLYFNAIGVFTETDKILWFLQN